MADDLLWEPRRQRSSSKTPSEGPPRRRDGSRSRYRTSVKVRSRSKFQPSIGLYGKGQGLGLETSDV